MEKEPIITIKNGRKYFYRFSVHQRIQHIILVLLVLTLILTGMPLKFHDAPWSSYLYAFFGGIKAAPIVHKTAGTSLILFFIYHLIYLALMFYRNKIAPSKARGGFSVGKLAKMIITLPLIPTWRDVEEVVGLVKYYLHFSNTRPAGGEWTWKDKFDYWAPFWGIPILASTGLIMWEKELATRLLPGEVINYALIAHSDEALLAALFLLIWHMYNVHFSLTVFPMGTAFISGNLPEEIMIEEHYEYYVEIMKSHGFEKEIRPAPSHRKGDLAPKDMLHESADR